MNGFYDAEPGEGEDDELRQARMDLVTTWGNRESFTIQDVIEAVYAEITTGEEALALQPEHVGGIRALTEASAVFANMPVEMVPWPLMCASVQAITLRQVAYLIWSWTQINPGMDDVMKANPDLEGMVKEIIFGDEGPVVEATPVDIVRQAEAAIESGEMPPGGLIIGPGMMPRPADVPDPDQRGQMIIAMLTTASSLAMPLCWDEMITKHKEMESIHHEVESISERLAQDLAEHINRAHSATRLLWGTKYCEGEEEGEPTADLW